MNTDKVKVGLLALIALTLIVNTYYQATSETPLPKVQIDQDPISEYSNIPDNTQKAQSNSTLDNPNRTELKDPTQNSLLNNEPEAASGPITNIKFATDVIDFGKVKAQSENTYAFEFVNTGTEPLLIENAKGSCGCTVPNWPKDPIMPGSKGKIDVVFRPKTRESEGEDKKTVTVYSNTNPKTTVLTVKAMVMP
jgi:hypothetical protein